VVISAHVGGQGGDGGDSVQHVVRVVIKVTWYSFRSRKYMWGFNPYLTNDPGVGGASLLLQ
jgi:hypothetical protein